MAAELRRSGVAAGDRVGLLLPHTPELVAAYHGILSAGAVAVPLLGSARPEPLTTRLRHARPRLLLHAPDLPGPAGEAVAAAGVDPAVPPPDLWDAPDAELPGTVVAPEAPAVLGYPLAGDSERPRAVVLSHRSLARAAGTLATEVLGLTPDDVVLPALPLHLVLGQTCGPNAVLSAGACLSVPSRFDPVELPRTLAEHEVSVLASYPGLLPTLLRAARGHGRPGGRRPDGLRLVLSTGAAAPAPRTHATLSRGFGCAVLAAYGPPEAAGLVCATAPGDTPPGSVGRAVGEMRVRVLDEGRREARSGRLGELAVSGPHLMSGYWDDPEATDRALVDGWFGTGDGARMGPDGHVYRVEGGWLGRVGRRGRLAGLLRGRG